MISFITVLPFHYGGPLTNGKYHYEIESDNDDDLSISILANIIVRFENLLCKIKSISLTDVITKLDEDTIQFVQKLSQSKVTSLYDIPWIFHYIENLIKGLQINAINVIISQFSEQKERTVSLTIDKKTKWIKNQMVKITGLNKTPELNGSFCTIFQEWQFLETCRVIHNGTQKTFRIQNLETVVCLCGEEIFNSVKCSQECNAGVHEWCFQKMMINSGSCTCGRKYETIQKHFSTKLSEYQCSYYDILMRENNKIFVVLIKMRLINFNGDVPKEITPNNYSWNYLEVIRAIEIGIVQVDYIPYNDCVLVPKKRSRFFNEE